MSDKITREGEKLNTIIGQGTVLKGECSVNGTVRVDGIIDGSLNATGFAILGKSGQIKGDLVVGNAIVAGKVDGSVIAVGKLELQTGSKVEGDITAKKLVVEEGVFFQGFCNMHQEAAAKGKRPSEPELNIQENKPSGAMRHGPKTGKVEEAGTDEGEEITFHGKPV